MRVGGEGHMAAARRKTVSGTSSTTIAGLWAPDQLLHIATWMGAHCHMAVCTHMAKVKVTVSACAAGVYR